MFNLLRCIRAADDDADGKRKKSAHLPLARVLGVVWNSRKPIVHFLSPLPPSLHVICVPTKDPAEGSLDVRLITSAPFG